MPEYSVYNLVSLCVLLDNIVLWNTDPMQREWIKVAEHSFARGQR